jgi:hypothetical protein
MDLPAIRALDELFVPCVDAQLDPVSRLGTTRTL